MFGVTAGGCDLRSLVQQTLEGVNKLQEGALEHSSHSKIVEASVLPWNNEPFLQPDVAASDATLRVQGA